MTNFLRFLLILPLLLHLAACGQQISDRLSPEDLATHNQAVGLMGQFNYDEALARFSDLARRHPDNPEFRVDLAIATLNRQQEGDEAAALAILAEVLQQQPRHLRALYTSGLLELNGGNAERAGPLFRQMVEADAGDAFAAYYLGLTLVQQGRHEEALPWYRKAIELDPHLRSAYYGAFQVLRQLRRDEEAREMLEWYQKLATDPRARQAEFKYTRMGPKAEVKALKAAPDGPAALPDGPLFGERQSLPLPGGVPEERANLTAADIDGDGRLDLYLAGRAVLLGEAGGGFRPLPDHPLASADDVNTALWGDIDNDGLLDVYLCRRGPNQLWRQQAPGQWREITSEATANGAADTVDGALFDADHDGDLDFFLVNADAPNELLNNNRDGSFRPLAQELGIAGRGPGRSVVVTDLDRDRDADLLVLNAAPPHEVWLNDLMWSYRPAPGFDAFRGSPLNAALAQDRDADGQPELYTLNSDGAAERWQPDAGGQWQGTPLSAHDVPGEASVPTLALLDVDGDGATELLRSTADGWGLYRIRAESLEPLVSAGRPGLGAWIPFNGDVARGLAIVGLDGGGLAIWPPGPGRHPFVGLTLSGREEKGESMRSNASGIGTHLALRTGSRWTVLESFRQYSGPGQGLQPLTIGLGGAGQADFVAIRWSDGVFQSELALEPGRLHAITETQRQLSSCPVLFAWDGEGYRFVSDLLGVGGIGFAIGRGEYAEPRPWENFQLPGGLLQPRGGRYLLKLTEPMEEAAYLDAARLVLYDLPPGWRMVLDERMSILGPEPSGEPRFYRGEMLPMLATNGRGDATASVTRADLRAATVGPLDRRFIGRLEREHRLLLEFPRPLDAVAGEPMLVIDGWVEYPYSQTLFAAWQAGAHYQAPSLDYQGVDGRWHTLLEQFGYPAGMPRRMSVPLDGLPPGVTRLRLRTNQEIYWDRIAVAYAETPPQVRRRPLPLRAAWVESTGFALRTTGEQRLPHYDYSRRLPLWDTRHMAGFYTELGAAQALVAEVDDALAIIGPGEEIHLEFDAPDSSPPAGWSRTLVFESNGWAKDMDLFTRDGDTLGPLPFLGAASEPRERLHAQLNTRYRSGR